MDIHKKFHEFVEYLNSLKLRDADLYQQYAMMKNAIKVLDERVEELSEMIVGEMETTGVVKQTFDFGTFTQSERKTWKYTEQVETLNQKLKETKKKEEESGVATFETKKSLLFRG